MKYLCTHCSQNIYSVEYVNFSSSKLKVIYLDINIDHMIGRTTILLNSQILDTNSKFVEVICWSLFKFFVTLIWIYSASNDMP